MLHLEGAPAKLAWYGWGLIYAIGERSFADADTDLDSHSLATKQRDPVRMSGRISDDLRRA
jgi:hypothetical protein